MLTAPNDNPAKRAALTPETCRGTKESGRKYARALEGRGGVLVFDGKGRSLCTQKDYANFEMLVDWKIHEKGDSGFYVRGTPQIRFGIRTTKRNARKLGSGGLFNNKKNPADRKLADKPIGEWNRFRILMVGERLHYS